jgi:hypothetical protein
LSFRQFKSSRFIIPLDSEIFISNVKAQGLYKEFQEGRSIVDKRYLQAQQLVLPQEIATPRNPSFFHNFFKVAIRNAIPDIKENRIKNNVLGKMSPFKTVGTLAPNDLTPCRMAFYFVSTFAIAQTPAKQPALRLSRTKNLHFAKATFPGFSAMEERGVNRQHEIKRITVTINRSV